jgi:hypothetical protein
MRKSFITMLALATALLNAVITLSVIERFTCL